METIRIEPEQMFCVELYDGENLLYKHILKPHLVNGMPNASEVRLHYEVIVHPDYITEDIKKEFSL